MRRAQQGLTLIELMISITIGLVVVGAVSYVYLGSKGAYRGNESVARVQEAGRFALDAIGRDIRRTGALGCGTAASVTTVSAVNVGMQLVNTSTATDPTTLMVDGTGQPFPIMGLVPKKYGPLTAAPAGWTAPAGLTYFNGDVVQMQIASGVPQRVTTTPNPAAGTLTINDNTLNGSPASMNFNPKDYAVLGNCAGAAIFQVQSNPAPAAATPAVLGFAPAGAVTSLSGQTDFATGTYPTLQHFDQVTYFVAQVPGSVSATYPNGLSALYRYSLNSGTAEELVENIEDLDIVYGVDTNGTHTAGIYWHADDVTKNNAWPNVVSVRVSLIAVGDQLGVAPVLQTLQFRGKGDNPVPNPWNAPDTRLRQVFTATAALRDRLPVL